MLGSRFPGEDLNVDKAGRQNMSSTVDDLGAFGRVAAQMAADVFDYAIGNQDAAGFVAIAGGVNDACVDENGTLGFGRLAGAGAHRVLRSMVGEVAGQCFEHGHAHGDTHFDLLADQAA